MKPVRWTIHALENLEVREIPRDEAEKTLKEPEFEFTTQFSPPGLHAPLF